MILVEELFFNLTLVMFPILIYFVYKCYNQIFINKYNFLMLEIALFTSVYMCFKYGEVGEYNTILLLYKLGFIELPSTLKIPKENTKYKTKKRNIRNIRYITTDLLLFFINAIFHHILEPIVHYV